MGTVSEQRVHTNLLHLRETVLCSQSCMHVKVVVSHIAVLEGQQSLAAVLLYLQGIETSFRTV